MGEAVAIQSDGKIIVVGYSYDGSTFDPSRVLVLRYNSDGHWTLLWRRGWDSYIWPTERWDAAFDLALQGDGKIVVAGQSYRASTGYEVLILRLDAYGILDPSFGEDGVVKYNPVRVLLPLRWPPSQTEK